MHKFAILNDTTRDKGHIGCRLVIGNLSRLCGENNISLYDKDCRENFNRTDYCDKLKNIDVVIINGEGTLHDNAGIVWFKKAEIAKDLGKRVYLVNAVWQNNSDTKKYLSLFDFVILRDELSFKEAANDGAKNAVWVPDLSFYSFNQVREIEISEKQNTLIIDSTVKRLTTQLIKYAYRTESDIAFMYEKRQKHTSAKLKYQLLNYLYNKKFYLLKSAEQMAQYQSIISGRYHACCLAMMLGIPTLGIDSNTWKTQSMYHEAELDAYFIKDWQHNLFAKLNFPKQAEIEWKEKSQNYAFEACQKIHNLYKNILQ